MMEQPSFDFEDKARDEAIQRGLDHAQEMWKARAREAIRQHAEREPFFTSCDVLAVLEAEGTVSTHDLRAMGGLMTAARKADIIEPSGKFVPSDRLGCHKMPKRVWRSLIYRPEGHLT
jgi:hypothetical protein